jgi:hypothetical protein
MQPRRSDSKKWTALPKDYLESVHTTITTQYKKDLKEVEVVVEGRVYDREVLVRIGFLPSRRLKQHNFELAFDVPEAKDQVLIKLNTSLDFLGSVFTEFFAKEGFENSEYEESLPILWKPVSFSKDLLHFQYSTVNSRLESMADEWLSKQDAALVNENRTHDGGMDAYNFAEQYDAETLEKIIELKKAGTGLSDDDPTIEGDQQHLH